MLIEKNEEWKESVGSLKLQGHFGDNFRLAFPYNNEEGIITGFLKRSLSPEGISVTTYDGKEHKNVRWDSTPGLNKDDLFGLDKVDNKEDTLIVVEGYPDAIYLRACGIENIVAVGQGKLGIKHLEALRKRKIKNMIISFDNDGVGPENTEEAVMMLLEKTRITPYVIDPGEYGIHKDPDEFSKANGIDQLKKIFNNKPVHGASWVVKGLLRGKENANLIEKSRLKDQILDFLYNVQDETIVEENLKVLEKEFDEKIASLKKQLKSRRKNYIEELNQHINNDPIIPFIDSNTNSYSYYNSLDDTLSLSVSKDIVKEIMLGYRLIAPEIFPTFKVKFDPYDMGPKFDLYNKTFNLFSPTEYMLQQRDDQKIDLEVSCPRTFELLKNLIPVESEREHFINWLSYVFTTRKKTRTSWVFQGVQGTGKNLFFDQVIRKILGKNQTIVVDDDRLQSDFNGFMNNKLFVAFNEVANDETKTKRSVKSKVKALISDTAMMINEKHIRTYEMDNYANIFFFSNESIPLLIEERDRRFNVVQTGDALKKVPSFKNDPEGFIEDLGKELKQFVQFLLNKKFYVSKVDEVIENDAKKQIKELSMNRYQLFASKVKAKDWDWFEENYPDPRYSRNGEDHWKELMTEAELNSKQVPREKLLATYNCVNSEFITITKLSRQLKMSNITIFRKRHDTIDDEYYYVW